MTDYKLDADIHRSEIRDADASHRYFKSSCPLTRKQVTFIMKSLLAASLIFVMFGFSQVTEACVVS